MLRRRDGATDLHDQGGRQLQLHDGHSGRGARAMVTAPGGKDRRVFQPDDNPDYCACPMQDGEMLYHCDSNGPCKQIGLNPLPIEPLMVDDATPACCRRNIWRIVTPSSASARPPICAAPAPAAPRAPSAPRRCAPRSVDAGISAESEHRRHVVVFQQRFHAIDVHCRRPWHAPRFLHGCLRRRLQHRGADRHRHRRDRSRHVPQRGDLPRRERLFAGAHQGTGARSAVPIAAGAVPLAALMVGNRDSQMVTPTCMRHVADYGTTPEQVAMVKVVHSQHAASNPRALYRKPVTVDEVLASRIICKPLHLLDCCVETDNGCAIIVTNAEHARNLKHPFGADPLDGRALLQAAHRHAITSTGRSPPSPDSTRKISFGRMPASNRTILSTSLALASVHVNRDAAA